MSDGDAFPLEPLLAVEELSVSYRTPEGPVPALAELSLYLARGEAVGVLGESGSGKSTLLRAIPGLLPAAATVAGEVRLDGAAIGGWGERRLRRLRGATIGSIQQDPGTALHPLRRIGAQVADVLRAHGRDGSRATVAARLAECGLGEPELAAAYPHELSGGQRQRAVVAQAIACRPALLLADEPTASLDGVAALELLGLLDELQRRHGLALLLVSHDPDVLAVACERLLVVHRGRLVEAGPTREVLRAPLHPRTAELLAARVAWPS